MISIKMIKSSKVASSYYKEADYYTKSEDGQKESIPSEWFGQGAERMGLSGAVEMKTFETSMEGRLPNGETLGRAESGGQSNHKKGWDFTLSAPKSVSILALAGGDERLLKAHQDSVKKALTFMEARLVVTRKGEAGITREERTGNLAAALFTHTTSRALDPQLHTHSVILNATQRQDEAWRSIESRRMYESAMLVGQVYRSELAKQVKGLGYSIEAGNKGTFEIKEVPSDIRMMFSKRRQAIVEAAKERGMEGAKNMDKAALMTRDAKKSISKEGLHERWQAELKSHDRDLTHIVKSAKDRQGEIDHAVDPGPQTQGEATTRPSKHTGLSSAQSSQAIADRASLKADVVFAYSHLAEREAVFSESHLLEQTLKRTVGSYTADDVAGVVDALKNEGKLLDAVVPVTGEKGFLTTPAALKKEQYILSLVNSGQKELKPVASRWMTKDIGAENGLSKDQQAALKVVLNTRDRVVGVQGSAGTGKTYMLATARALATRSGYNMRGFAMTGTAAEKLQEDSGIKSQTLASHLYSLENDRKETRGGVGKNNKEIWVVDEASLINSNNMADLLTHSRKQGARVVLLGDRAQIGAIEWGKPFNQLLRAGMTHAEMTDIQRQRNNPLLLGAVKDSIVGEARKALQKLENAVFEERDADKRSEMITRQYLSLSPAERGQTLVIIPDNETRAKVNDSIRAGLQARGELGEDELQAHVLSSLGKSRVEKGDSQSYEPGQWVQFAKAFKTLGVDRNELVRVERVEGRTVFFRRSNGDIVEWRPDQVAGKSKHGVEIYRKEDRGLAAGDKIQWRKTDHDLGLKNGHKGDIVSINGGDATIKFNDGRTLKVDLRKEQHWDHAYATTVFSAQGQTYKNAIVLAESWRRNLINQKSFYVGISRARDNAYLYTDNKEKLIKGIEQRTGEKTSSLEGRRISIERLFGSDGLMRETRWEKAVDRVRESVGKALGKTRGDGEKDMSL